MKKKKKKDKKKLLQEAFIASRKKKTIGYASPITQEPFRAPGTLPKSFRTDSASTTRRLPDNRSILIGPNYRKRTT